MIVFFMLFIWRVGAVGLDWLSAVFSIFFLVFFFYSVNYRTLLIRITPAAIKLTFGIFTWAVPVNNIQTCCLDELPNMMKYGGAGIHFMTIRKRYRASFNFLEFPRVVISFKNKIGPVQDLSFSTRKPEVVMQIIHGAMEANLHE
jgi:hypothetical protein